MKKLLPFIAILISLFASCDTDEDPQPDPPLAPDAVEQPQTGDATTGYSQMYFPSATEWQTVPADTLGLSAQAIDELLKDIAEGRKYMKVYKQMKMYNDPSLNPVLYQQQANEA